MDSGQVSDKVSSKHIEAFNTAGSALESEAALLRSVFGWMTAGLATTGLVGSYVMQSAPAMTWLQSNFMFLVLAELGLVFWLAARVMKMSAGTATAVFLGYSALNGVTIAPLLSMASQQSISTAFMTTALLFGSMAIYGKMTSRDLSGMGSFMMMGLMGALIAAVVNIFLGNSMLHFITSVIFIIVCTGLTAWDVQRIKKMAFGVQQGSDDFRRVSIASALSLYLNFIIIFQNLLHLLDND